MQHYYFITGASRGIGKALVERALQEENTQVYGLSRSQSVEHSRYHHIAIDLSDIGYLQEKIDTLFPEVAHPRRIVLINNAGTLGDVSYVGDISPDSMATLINLNVTVPIMLVNQLLRAYGQVDTEKIVINVSSGAGKYPVDGWSGYCTSKAALDMFTQVAALEQDRRKETSGYYPTKFYALAPGVVDTDMQSVIRGASVRQFSTLDKFLKLKEHNELAGPAEVAAKFFYLINHTQQFQDVLQDVRNF